MKNRILPALILLLLLLNGLQAVQARAFYLSSSGNDANSGLSAATPWRTITKLNASFGSIVAGDSVLFRRGDSFFGAIVISKSGSSTSPLYFGAYGTGAKPIISGFVPITAWTSIGNGVYQAAATTARPNLNMVSLDGKPVALGRFPNADAENGGFLSYESFDGSSAITDNQLTSTTNWTGAEVVIRKKLWVLDRCRVINHVGGTITYTNTNNSTYEGTNGYGYFFQNDPRTLDQLGEWYYSSTGRYIQMYFGNQAPSSYSVKVSAFDTLISINSRNYLSLNDLVLEGANGMTVYVLNSTGFTMRNCDLTSGGLSGITVQNTGATLIENCTTNYMLNNGMSINNARVSPTTVRNCSIKNSGALPGMGNSNGNSYKALLVNANDLVVEYNKIDTAGYVGLEFQGSNVQIRYNVIDHYCYIKDDGAGIYTYTYGTDAAPGTIYTNRVISNNIVMNGIGAPFGRSTTSLFVSGIYLDGRTMNVDVLNNTIFNNGKNGIHCNNPINVNIRGNTSYKNLNAMSVARWATTGNISNLAIKKNIFYPVTSAQRCLMYTNTGLNEPVVTTFEAALQGLGSIDSNVYSMLNPTGFNFEYYLTTGGAGVPASPMSLEAWKATTLHDAASRRPVRLPFSYKLNSLVGTNKYVNSQFTSNISGVTIFGANVLGAWDNTGRIAGGALRISFSLPTANRYALVHSPVGAIDNSKKYILRFSTFGTSVKGIARAYIRKTASPYNNLVPIQVRSFGAGITNHEILFDAPTTDVGGSVCIEIEQNSGTTFIDNVAFFEANATILDAESQIEFLYNTNRSTQTFPLDGAYIGVDGTLYNGNATLQPFTSLILVKDTSAPVNGALKVTAAAPPVKCNGGTTIVTVAADGGTAPYIGTGTFTVPAGIYNYTVTDAAGASNTVSVIVTQPAAPLAVTATAGTIASQGGSTTVSVTARGGTPAYTGVGTFTRSAGTYTFTVIDANGCAATATITITDGAPPVAPLAATAPSNVSISCFNAQSTVSIGATGGTAPYTGTGNRSISAGRGSLKLSFPVSTPGIYTALYHTIGPVSVTKTYVIRFSTVGSSTAGVLRVALRQTNSPWATITTKQRTTFGRGRQDHSFIIANPSTQTAASYLIEIDQAAGTTYIDNIAVFEATPAGVPIGNKLNTDGQFESNITAVFAYSSNGNHRLEWDTTGKITNTHYFTVRDSVNATAVTMVTTTQPAAPLTVTAVAGVLNATTGLVPFTVNATGGTAPYTGTGVFNRVPGTYSFVVTDANGCSSSVTASATQGGRITSAANTAARLANPSPTVLALKVIAYPNPSATSFSLVVEGGTGEPITLEVFSYDGKRVYQAEGSASSKYNFGANFLAGVYTVKVTQGIESRVQKIIKTNQ